MAEDPRPEPPSAPPPPPPAGWFDRPDVVVDRPAVDWTGAARLLVVLIAAGALAALAGVAVGVAVYAVALGQSSSQGGWEELGAAIFGALAGVVAGTVAYTVAATAGIRRAVPAGHRLRAAAGLVTLPVVALFAVGAPSGVAGTSAPSQVFAGGAMLALVAAAVVLSGWVAGVVQLRRATVAGAASAVVGLALLGGAFAFESQAEDGRRQATFERLAAQGGLVLVDGRALDAPDLGLSATEVRVSNYDDSLSISYDLAGGGDAHLQIGGSYIYGDRPSIGAVPVDFLVHGDGPDGYVRAEAIRQRFLSRLQPVSASVFTQACGRRC